MTTRDAQIVSRARALAKAKGHNNVEEPIVCSDGTTIPVWGFYIDKAAQEIADGEQAPRKEGS